MQFTKIFHNLVIKWYLAHGGEGERGEVNEPAGCSPAILVRMLQPQYSLAQLWLGSCMEPGIRSLCYSTQTPDKVGESYDITNCTCNKSYILLIFQVQFDNLYILKLSWY